NGGARDTIIDANLTADATITLSAPRDVIVSTTVTAHGAASDILIEADSDNDGVGGFWLKEGPVATDAQLQAGRHISIQGSDLFADAMDSRTSADAIRIDADAAATPAAQLVAGGDITLTGKIIDTGA